MMAVPLLYGQRRSALLAVQLEFCPRGKEGTRMFAGPFLQRLPRELRLLLTNEDLMA